MSEESKPLRDWTASHIIGALGLASATLASWVTLNERVARVESSISSSTESIRDYRVENTRRLERIEENQTKLMMALGVKPEQ
jgi:hypothetical protein